MNLINMTPHEICFADQDGNVVARVPPSGTVARCAASTQQVDVLAGIPVVTTRFGEVVGLPEPTPGVVLVTSTLVAQRAARADVLSPDTGPTAVRQNGQVVAVRALQSFAA